MSNGNAQNIGKLILRMTLGVVFLSHGLPKLLGGAAGMGEFLSQLGVPLAGVVAWSVAFLEVAGGALLLLGILVTPAAVLLAFHMLAGIVLIHGGNGWYVVGPGQGGAEFNVVLIAGLLALVLIGEGPGLYKGVRRRDSITESLSELERMTSSSGQASGDAHGRTR